MFTKTLGSAVLGVRKLKENTIGKITEAADAIEAREKDFRSKLSSKVDPIVNDKIKSITAKLGIDVNNPENEEPVKALREEYTRVIARLEVEKFRYEENIKALQKESNEQVNNITKSFVGANLNNAQVELQLEMLQYLRSQNQNNH